MLNELTPSEKLWLYAKQRNVKQHEALALLGITAYRYKTKPVALKVSTPTQLQWLVLFRKRSQLSAREIGRQLGVSKMFVSYMENGICYPDRLIEFWSKNVPAIFRDVVSEWSLGADGNRPD